ncbi:MAG: nucleoside 2-deoxyribosyltransferase [Lentisphaeria bacterium]|nr:nucleoside 2-deoxyribosyltransferase [Lentisphaeria bacterium]
MNTRRIYFAGDLFDHKDITGNLLLAREIEDVSPGRYIVALPQDSEANNIRNVTEIRDRDLELLFSCDCIVANFDGTELDSGTVVEFCFAKMLDLPAVLLRTDFRRGGDNGSDPWNLMCSGYPRSSSLLISAMEQYHRLKKSTPAETVRAMCRETAQKITGELDKLFAESPVLTPQERIEAMKLAVRTAGGTLGELFPEERIIKLVSEKSDI